MSDDSEYANYVKDYRIVCKYGAKCYQKNPMHHQKYKHPSKKNKQHLGHINKKIKIDKGNKETKEIITSNDVSDSDENDTEESSDTLSSKNSDELSVSETRENGTTNKKDEDVANSKNETLTTATKPFTVQISNGVSSASDDSRNANVDKDEKTNAIEDNTPVEKKIEKRNSDKFDNKQFIRAKFLVDMPTDFYQFWNYCKQIKPNDPLNALKDIGLKLVGPFDVLAGKFVNVNKSDEEYLLHWRYYYDPPEMQTVLKGDDKTGFHIGYFRDSPDESPIFLASNCAKKDGVLHQMGPNIFAAINMYLDDLKKTGDPFKKMHVDRMQSSIKKEAENLKVDLTQRTDAIISREKKVVTRTFNKIGLVVPYNRKSQLGYRELALNNKDLNTLFTKLQNALPEQRPKYLAELQPVFTNASIAADECDFGTGIELGWNIISHGVDSLNSTALRFLATNYRLLNKEVFAKIAEAHMSNRKKGCDLGII
ncbi:histone PARylation factor 1 [Anoplophora glabripennis]|uniref:histone PARylation factor 1 n=1 Tax=Anoplophora glabripennis TaxID=217634 RepID=UPI0008739325|nr:histone PARylation factor 1 [Anoplophora glabripennis]